MRLAALFAALSLPLAAADEASDKLDTLTEYVHFQLHLAAPRSQQIV